MPKTYKISEQDVARISEIRSKNHDKQVDKRLRSVQLRGEGKSNQEIAAILETSSDMVSRWVSLYATNGLEALLAKKRKSNHYNMSYDEEVAFLESFKKKAEQGQIVETSEIKAAYIAAVGHTIGSGQIYYVLKRHGWRKIMPRSKHPKKATDEVIETSKKLTIASKN